VIGQAPGRLLPAAGDVTAAKGTSTWDLVGLGVLWILMEVANLIRSYAGRVQATGQQK
jgi:hypothetical protein